MKKKYVLIVIMAACLCLLAGCFGAGNNGIGSNVKFLHFVDDEGALILDYQLDQYFNSDKLQKTLDETEINYCTLGAGKYLDGTEFSVEKDKINDYIINHEADLTVTLNGFLLNTECPAYTVVMELVPKEYTITYVDVEGAVFDGPTTYNVKTDKTLPTATKEFYHFLGWYEKGFDEGRPVKFVMTELPYVMHDLTLYAVWEPISFDMKYEGLAKSIENTNKDVIYQKDGVYELISIPSTAAYTFNGWKSNGEYVTSVDPVAIWDPSAPSYDIDAYTVVLTADIVYHDFNVNYYVDDELFQSYVINYHNFNDFKAPAVPSKEHYTGRWAEKVTAYQNYDIDAVYDIDKYDVDVKTNISGYTVNLPQYEYGTTYQSVYDKLSYTYKKLQGLYLESDFKTRVNENDFILSSGSLYAKWVDWYTISSASDWALISQHKDAYFSLENDINFLGEAIPVIEQFNGVLDGNNHTISNFINQNTSCAATYGLFCVNNGVIKNITFADGVYTAVSTKGRQDIIVGFLSGNNKGTIQNVCVSDLTVKITCWHYVSHRTSSAETLWLNAGILAGKNNGTIENSRLTNTVKAEMNTQMYSMTEMRLDDNFTRTWAAYGTIVGTNCGQVKGVTSSAVLSSDASRTDEKADWLSNYYAYAYFPLQVGGLVGNNAAEGTIENSLSNAELYVHHSATAARKFLGILDIGGITGVNYGQISKCYVSKNTVIDAYSNAETRVGGISGTNDGKAVIKASYSEAEFIVGNASKSEKTYFGGIVGLNNAAVSYCYAVMDNIGCNPIAFNGEGISGYCGGLFGYGQQSSSAINCYAIINDGSPVSLASTNQGKSVGATVVKCYTYLTGNATGFSVEGDATDCATEDDLLAQIAKLGYANMGFTIGTDGYPVLSNVGYQEA